VTYKIKKLPISFGPLLSTSKFATEPVFASILKSFDRKAPKPQNFSNSMWSIATSEIYAKGNEIVIKPCADLL
jgi:hypothetical protein